MTITFLMGPLPARTGGERYNYRIQQFLERNGYDVKHVDLTRHLPHGCDPTMRLRHLVATWLLLARMFGRDDGVQIQDEFFARFMFLANLVRRLRRRGSTFVVVHHLQSNEHPVRLSPLRRLVERWYLSLASQIIVVSRFTQRQVIATGVKPSRTVLAPNGFEPYEVPPPLPRYTTLDDAFQVVCVAQSLPRKGLEHLLEAVALLEPGTVRLSIAGDIFTGYFRDTIAPLVARLNMGDWISFEGYVPRTRLHELYATADVFVLPSLMEGFGVVLLEAMHAGVPVIASRAGGIPEAVRDGQNGILVPPGDPRAIADAIDQLRLDPLRRKLMGEQARATTRNWPGWDDTGRAVLQAVETRVFGPRSAN